MTPIPRRPAPDGYQLRVAGHLDDHWARWFSDLTLHRENDGTTTLRGFVADQAELHGLLMKIRDLGVTLISVEVIDPATVRGKDAGWLEEEGPGSGSSERT